MDEILRGAESARSRIADWIRNTPLEHSSVLSLRHGADVFLKLDNLQVTGSFKIRGAMAKLSLIPKDVLERGIVTASSGNHGAAVACAISQLGGSAIVFVPNNASQIKCDAIQRYGAQVQRHGDDGLVSELYAQQFALEHDRLYVSPYNDPDVVAGQGTMGLEILESLPDVDAVFVTVGGGGLISGVAGVLKALRPNVRDLLNQDRFSRLMHGQPSPTAARAMSNRDRSRLNSVKRWWMNGLKSPKLRS
jgi:threonine dehydratase